MSDAEKWQAMADADPISRLLADEERGGGDLAEALLPLVYDKLKRLARQQMARERSDHTLQPTALVHEAYLRLVGNEDLRWSSRAQFYNAAARAMRRILVDHARAQGNQKRGGDRTRHPAGLIDLVPAPQSRDARAAESDQMLALDGALSRLEVVAPDVGEVVRLRFFAGLSIEETASALGVSPRTVKRDWTFAKAWLRRDIDQNSGR